MKRLALIALAPLAFAAPGAAQPMDPNMPGMSMPAPKKAATKPKPAPAHPAPPMSTMPGMAMPATASSPTPMDSMPGMAMPTTTPTDAPMADMPGMVNSQAATPSGAPDMPNVAPPEPPHSPPPPPPTDHAADRVYGPVAMGAARAQLRREHGGTTISKVMANVAEYQSRPGGGGYRWDGEAWIGGDINRFVVRSEGEGARRDGLEAGEAQALYSRAIGPYTDLQAGVRQDFSPRGRTYVTVGFQSLAPYWFDLSGALFLSTTGELLGRLEAIYDLRLTQRLILQPRVELNFAAQDTVVTRRGSGLSNAELGLRLRYEITREFAPYVGLSWDRKLGKTADYARALGEGAGGLIFVAGIRTWF